MLPSYTLHVSSLGTIHQRKATRAIQAIGFRLVGTNVCVSNGTVKVPVVQKRWNLSRPFRPFQRPMGKLSQPCLFPKLWSHSSYTAIRNGIILCDWPSSCRKAGRILSLVSFHVPWGTIHPRGATRAIQAMTPRLVGKGWVSAFQNGTIKVLPRFNEKHPNEKNVPPKTAAGEEAKFLNNALQLRRRSRRKTPLWFGVDDAQNHHDEMMSNGHVPSYVGYPP